MPANISRDAAARFRILAPLPGQAGPMAVSPSRGTAVSVYEWRCTGHDGRRPDDEHADDFEVVVPRRGAFEWRIDGEHILADPGTATLLPRHATYRVRHPLDGGDAGTVFRLPEPALRALLAAHEPGTGDRSGHVPAIRLPLDGRTYLLHRLALHAARAPTAGELEIEERALRFLRAVLADAGVPRPARRARMPERAEEYVCRVREVIAARYREPLTLAQVAGAVGVSPFHLARLVTAVTGVPIYRMVLRRRLREALELVLETRESLARIAAVVGFASQSHLTDAFRREYGHPPGELRRATSPRR
jgi:AraC-like DNA-binding protein